MDERYFRVEEDTEPVRIGSQHDGTRNDRISHQVTRFYEEQIRRSGHYDRLKQIVEPSSEETCNTGLLDTSGEHENTIMPGLQHKYPQTAVILATNKCFSHCRFCFRMRMIGADSKEIASDYRAIADYIQDHPEVNNVLLTGGDPLVLSTDHLEHIIECLLPIPHVTAIRIGTRALVYYPPRFSDEKLLRLFERIASAGKMGVIVTHIEHFGEISKETEMQIQTLRKAGVQFFNQTVLLKDVNDDPGHLAATFKRMHLLGVQPYYLFQARPVRGGLHFQVPLRRGVEIVHGICRCLSGIQKTFRYIMSHSTGKVEILDMSEDGRLYMRYHQNRDTDMIGRVFSRFYREGSCWLDDLPLE
jgi:KamA family protein